jgi:opacity protein-like surface antigen
MKAIKIALLCLIIGGFSTSASAQRWFRTSSLEFGLMGGASMYSGDLTAQFFETRGMHPAGGLITRWTPAPRVSFRLSAVYGKLSGYDEWYSDDEFRFNRNLDFESVLWDFTAGVQWNLNELGFKQESGAIPYLWGGFSVFKFNPKAQFNYNSNSPHLIERRNGSNYDGLEERDGEWVELQPLGTEGQKTTQYNDRDFYSLTQLAIPVGLGVNFKLNKNWSLGLEWGTRITFTDYIDDAGGTYAEPDFLEAQYGAMSAAMADRSPTLNEAGTLRADDTNKDLYSIFGVTFTYRIYGNREKCATF